MEILFFDVGLGDCTLLCCGGQTMLIDGGSYYPLSLQNYLREKHINYIDTMICTHAHGDHSGGLAELMQEIAFGNVYCNTDYLKDHRDFQYFHNVVQGCGKEILVPQPGGQIALGEAAVTFLGPVRKYDNGNDNSLVLRVDDREHSVLFCADAGLEAERDMIRSGADLKADVIRVGHHGLDGSTSGEWLSAVNPEFAVISYGPSKFDVEPGEVIARLESRGIKTYRTDRDGDILCRFEGPKTYFNTGGAPNKLIGKKLLILGANKETSAIVKTARRQGIYTIVTDHTHDAPAKSEADKSYDIDGKDVEKLAEMALQEDVDGILVGVADPLACSYQKLCSRLGLPCYLTPEILSMFMDKRRFKAECTKYGLPTAKEIRLSDIREGPGVSYPVVVKPSVCRGGKGVFLCKNREELEECAVKAERLSDNGEMLAEEFIDGEEIISTYLIADGEPRLVSLCDRICMKNKDGILPVTLGCIYPSKYSGLYRESCDERIRDMAAGAGMKNGILQVQSFLYRQEVYPYDPAIVLAGEMVNRIHPEVLGVDLIRHMIHFSLTGSAEIQAAPPWGHRGERRKCAASFWFLLREGRIGKISGLTELENETHVLDLFVRLKEGDRVTAEMAQTEKSTLARIYLTADTREELKDLLSSVQNRLTVRDEEGNDMLIKIPWQG